MPGIFGFVNYRGDDIKTDLLKMANRMGSEFLTKTNIWYDSLGGVGLGYIGSDVYIQEDQPASLKSGVKMVFYGEIVGEEEIRESLIKEGLYVDHLGKVGLVFMLFLHHGIDSISEINGSHAIAIWDELNQKLILVPDRFGQRSIYFSEINGTLVFASEIKSLLVLDFVPKSINPEAVMEYLAIEQLNYDRTFLKWIKRIPYGSVFSYQKGQMVIENRWPVLYHQPEKEWSESEYIEEFIYLSRLAVSKRLKNQKVCIGLSGGIDSRLLTALVINEKLDIDTVTYGQKGSRDLMRGKEVAEVANLFHNSLVLHDDYLIKYAGAMIDRVDGFFNVLNCHGMILTEISSHYPVIALANGLDQFVWSSRSKNSVYQNCKNIAKALFQTQNEFIYQKDWRKWFTSNWYEKTSETVYQNFIADFERVQTDTIDNCIDSYIVQTYASYFGSSLPMVSHKMEFTEPFYDIALIKFFLNLPLSMRWNRKLEKAVLSTLSPDLAKIDGGPLAEFNYLEKTKKKLSKIYLRSQIKLGLQSKTQLKPPSSTYSDLHKLLRTKKYRLWLEKTLLTNDVIISDIFRPEILKQLVYQHTSGDANHTKALGVILTMELYLKNIFGNYPELRGEKELGLSISPLSIGD